MRDRYILNFTPNGLIPTRETSATVPLSIAEIVEQVSEAATLGANMVHVHARDPETGGPSSSAAVYGEIIVGIRTRHPELVICVSTSGRISPAFEDRSACLELEGARKPDFASLTLGSLNFARQASVNSPEMIKALATKMAEAGIRPELEVFDLGMINYAHYLIERGLLQPPYYFNLILGGVAGAQADLSTLGLMVDRLPPGALWSVGGIGRAQFQMNAMGLLAGGGVRVGLEDNLHMDSERTQAATNAALVRRIVELGRMAGREPYAAADARKVLGLA